MKSVTTESILHEFNSTVQPNYQNVIHSAISCVFPSWLSEACCYMAEMGQAFNKPLSGSRTTRALSSGLIANMIVHGMGYRADYSPRELNTASNDAATVGIGLQRERAVLCL